jgi:hypothetical protein
MNIYLVASEDRKVFGYGQTERSFAERHKDTDWNKFRLYLKARGEKLVLISWYENVNITDHDIHNFLEIKSGIERFSEWFNYRKDLHSIDSIKQQVENKFFIAKNRKRKVLDFRSYQKEFVAKAQSEYLEFLLFAKCRAGKSVMTLAHIVDRGFKITLIVSRFTSPFQSWESDPQEYDLFKNIRLVSLYDSDWIEQIKFWSTQPEIQIILTSTIQGLNKKLDTLFKTFNLDLLVFDECHVGSNGTQFKKLREKFADTPCLKVSGTAYDQVWEYTDANRYVYSYFEEQLDVKQGLYHRPKMNVFVVKYQTEEYQKVFGDDPDAMKNIFAIEDNKFKYESLVRDFIIQHFDEKRRRLEDRLFANSQHILMCLPSVAACHLFAELIDGFYLPFVVTGETGRKSVDIEKFIGENFTNKTMTITCEANVLGVTQKKWDTIINCKGGKDPKFWTQFAFRGGSGENDWNVVDFSAQLCLESLRKAYILAEQNNPQLSSSSFIDFVAISEWQDKFEKLSEDKINEIFAADVGDTVNIMSSVSNKIDAKGLDRIDFDLQLKPSTSNVTKSVEVNDNGANNKTNLKKDTITQSGEKSDFCIKLKTIKAILECIPLVLFYELNDGKRVGNIEEVLSSKYYTQTTNDYESVLYQCLHHRIIKPKDFSYSLNQCLVDIQESLKKSFADTLDALCVSSSVQQGIPSELFDKMTSTF